MLLFTILSIFNVVLSTIRSLATIKCGKLIASIVNAIYYGYYTVVLVFTVCDDIPLWLRVVICSVCNLFGVFIVKMIEEKIQKDKLWKIECTIKNGKQLNELDKQLAEMEIPHNYFSTSKDYWIVNIFCATQKESAIAKEILGNYEIKYFVSESKVL